MHTKQVATMLAAAAMVMAGSAWGYGVEGWPNGTPDHVVKAGKASQGPIVQAEGCGGCCGKDKKGGSTKDGSEKS